MNISIFQSEKGDCLLLKSDDNHYILVDGGMRASFVEFVAPVLSEIEELDLVYVSHIDQDHIAGVLELMDNAVDWRVHEHQINNNNTTHPVPTSPKPPRVKELWHNSFHELIGENAGPIGNLLAANFSILSGGIDEDIREMAIEQRDLATSIPEAIRLSRRANPEQLGISLNRQFDGKLAFVREDQSPPSPIKIGSLKINVIGPFAIDLEILKTNWNNWLTANQKRLLEIQKQARRDAERLGTNDLLQLMDLQIEQAKKLGNRNEVTPPNLASLMLLIVENGKTVLLTGDGHADDILKGLKFHKKLDDEGRIHVNVLKVQHHGAKANIDTEFVSKVTADHYIFSGNGEHHNPELDVIKLILDSRLREKDFSTDNPKAKGDFTFWFNSSFSATKKSANKEHMSTIFNLVSNEQANSNDRFHFNFLQDSTPFLTLKL